MTEGPGEEEQARVDAEQRELIQRMRAERQPAEEERTRALALRREQAEAERVSRRKLAELVNSLVARVEALEKRLG